MAAENDTVTIKLAASYDGGEIMTYQNKLMSPTIKSGSIESFNKGKHSRDATQTNRTPHVLHRNAPANFSGFLLPRLLNSLFIAINGTREGCFDNRYIPWIAKIPNSWEGVLAVNSCRMLLCVEASVSDVFDDIKAYVSATFDFGYQGGLKFIYNV